jgi:Xaa-Pro aminopeptidase
VAALAEAGAAIDSVHAAMGEWLLVGRTEREVANDIAEAIRGRHKTVDFVIVASGPNSASPHHEVSDRVIEAGDPVVVDIGGTTAAGYCSDSTRVYHLGDPTPEYVKAYDVLLAAQEAGVQAAVVGATAESVDAAARRVLAEAGLGEYFIHRTGHGIGVETHEHPYLVAGNTDPLAVGDAFSVEPGFYIPDRYGARIEDIVVCTEDGPMRLNHTPRELNLLSR